MKQFRIIFQFELMSYLKNKIFIGVTLFLVAVIAAVMYFPRIQAAVNGWNRILPASAPDGEEAIGVMLLAAEDAYAQDIRDAFEQAFPEYYVTFSDGDLGTIKADVKSGRAECAFVIDSLSSYTYYVGNLSMTDANTEIADKALQNLFLADMMVEHGISMERAKEALSMPIAHTMESLGKNQVQNFFYTYIMIFSLYMVILLYGQMVATNVATEKSSRAMELLVTSAKPVGMMFGKVLASCLAGFLQLLLVFGSSILLYHLNRDYLADNWVITSIFHMPVGLLVYMLVFFVLGFFVYAFLFGAIGSTASKVEDINTAVMPLTMLFVFSFLIVMFSMSGGNVDSLLMRICSFVPFTSPMAMFTRIAMSTVPVIEVAASILILIASVAGIGVISAKIYRVCILLYGTPPKFGSILKALKKA